MSPCLRADSRLPAWKETEKTATQAKLNTVICCLFIIEWHPSLSSTTQSSPIPEKSIPRPM